MFRPVWIQKSPLGVSGGPRDNGPENGLRALHAKHSPDGARLGLDGVGGTENDTADLDGLETGPDHADDGAGCHW